MNRLITSAVAASRWGQQVCRTVVRASSSASAKSSSMFDDQKFSNDDTQSRNRPYQNLFPWKDELQLAKLLIANIVFVDRGLIAINKPYGLGMHVAERQIPNAGGSKSERAVHQEMLSSEIVGSPRYCLADVLDYMAQLLNVQRLSLVKCKWSSAISKTKKCNYLIFPLGSSRSPGLVRRSAALHRIKV